MLSYELDLMKAKIYKNHLISSYMNKKYTILIIIIVLILISLVALVVIFRQDYKPFQWDGDKCITYYKSCTCIGSLITTESYPPKYKCRGLNFCENINVIECG